MARTPTPAQIAARKRFAEMARSGAFTRKAKRNPRPKHQEMTQDRTVYKRYTIIYPRSGDTFYIVRDNTNIGSARSLDEAKGIIDMLTEGSPNPRAARRPSLYVGPDPGNRFAQCYSALDDIDFESPYFRERRVTLAKARKANAMLDKVLDMMEKIAKIING